MPETQDLYIALGSNSGDRFHYLQAGIDALFERVGTIEKISPVYESPAWGFDGQPFYNCVARLTTDLSSKHVLEYLLAIEKEQGRERHATEGYQDRTLDLDILFHGSAVIETENLRVPHPELDKRRFVLQPLSDLAPELLHPRRKLSIQTLLDHCNDASVVEKLPRWLKNPKDAFSFSNVNYISIEGNIGAGKTALATKIATDFQAKLVLERFADNPFLPKFYNAPDRYAFPLEMSFLADRYQQAQEDWKQMDLFAHFTIADYDVNKSLIFAGITLQSEEFALYRRLFNLMYKDAPQPDRYVFLHQRTERLLENIQKRGREYEQSIAPDYLESIQRGYLDFIKSRPQGTVKIIDVSRLDFVKNRKDYLQVLHEITGS